jgi:hypothetical protein
MIFSLAHECELREAELATLTDSIAFVQALLALANKALSLGVPIEG